jgi:hypothetical protein
MHLFYLLRPNLFGEILNNSSHHHTKTKLKIGDMVSISKNGRQITFHRGIEPLRGPDLGTYVINSKKIRAPKTIVAKIAQALGCSFKPEKDYSWDLEKLWTNYRLVRRFF